VTQAAWQVADQGLREAHQAVGDAGGIHKVGGEQKERDGQEDKGVVGLEHLGQKNERGQAFIDEENRDAGETESKGDRHPQ